MKYDSRDPALDLMRALSMLYIVGFWHLVPYAQSWPGYATIITEGVKDIALATFVFCSGLLLAGRSLEWNMQSIRRFYFRRVLRIYPLYALSLLLFLTVGLAEGPVVVNALLLRSMFTPPAPYTLWFVSMIMVYYLAAPLLIILADTSPFYALITLSLPMALTIHHLRGGGLDPRIIVYLPCFLLSIRYARRRALRQGIERRQGWLTLLLLPAFLLYQYPHDPAALSATWGKMPLLLLATPLLHLLAKRLAGLFPGRAVFLIAYASYGMYLFHRPIILLAINIYFPASGTARLCYLIALVLPAILIISLSLQYAYDRCLRPFAPLVQINHALTNTV